MNAHPVLVAVIIATLAAALTPWVLREVGTRSRWLTSGLHVALAAGAGTGAALLASSWWELAAYSALALSCALLVPADLAVQRLPDRIVGPTYLATYGPLLGAAATSDQWARLGEAAGAGVAAFAAFLALALLPSGWGMGDVKLAGVLVGALAWTGGWQLALVGTVAMLVAGGIVAATLMLVRRETGFAFAYGPSMIAGFVLVLASPTLLG